MLGPGEEDEGGPYIDAIDNWIQVQDLHEEAARNNKRLTAEQLQVVRKKAEQARDSLAQRMAQRMAKRRRAAIDIDDEEEKEEEDDGMTDPEEINASTSTSALASPTSSTSTSPKSPTPESIAQNPSKKPRLDGRIADQAIENIADGLQDLVEALQNRATPAGTNDPSLKRLEALEQRMQALGQRMQSLQNDFQSAQMSRRRDTDKLERKLERIERKIDMILNGLGISEKETEQ